MTLVMMPMNYIYMMDSNLVTQYFKSIGYETINFDGGNFFA